jgi:AraC-like DNA-binding protein
MPRGALQIAQPAKLPEGLVRAYAREFHLEDRLSWQAIQAQRPVAAAEALAADSRFLTGYLQAGGFAHAAAAPLKAPILEGYPGALHVYRTAEQGPFSAEDLAKLGEVARQADQIIERARAARRGGAEDPDVGLTPRPRTRLFVFDPSGKQILGGTDFESLDDRVRNEMVEHARTRFGRESVDAVTGDRVQLPDSRGDLWTFRAVTFPAYPAIGDGPFVVFTLQPTCNEWGLVRPMDLQADQELARLIPALKFMKQEFHRGPTLGEIAKQVHLSPFHFHRRFAELLGLTPKHYLLECQITQAKVELLARRKELSQIATDCGFAHQSHVTSRFKQGTGLSPTRWRRLASEAKRD